MSDHRFITVPNPFSSTITSVGQAPLQKTYSVQKVDSQLQRG